MSSKVVVLLGLSLAVCFMIASEVTARELAETTTTSSVDAEKANGVADGRSGYNKGVVPDGYGHGGHGGGGYGHGGHGGCRYGCCGHGHGGCKCCSYEGEKVDAEKP